MSSGNYDVFRACAVGDIEYIKKSLSAGLNPNSESEMGWTLLIYAVENERKELVEFLIKNGANINFQSSGGVTPLHQAVDLSIDGTIQTGGTKGDEPTDMIKCLMDHGADVSIKDNHGRTPIDTAKIYNSEKIIRFLKEYRWSSK